MTQIIMILISYISGSLPFSVWLTKIFSSKDVRKFGDGNPGAANAFKAGNNYIGLLVLMLDISKAAAPVGIAFYNLNIRGIPMFLIAIAPVVGHIFSPFLKFKGGKAIATSLGTWIGLTIWRAPLPAVITVVIAIIFINSPGWAVMFGMLTILIVLLGWMPSTLLISIWLVVTCLVAWTHRHELRHAPKLRSWLNPEHKNK